MLSSGSWQPFSHKNSKKAFHLLNVIYNGLWNVQWLIRAVSQVIKINVKWESTCLPWLVKSTLHVFILTNRRAQQMQYQHRPLFPQYGPKITSIYCKTSKSNFNTFCTITCRFVHSPNSFTWIEASTIYGPGCWS